MSDLIERQAAIAVAKQHWYKPDIAKALEDLPSAHPIDPCETCVYNGKGWDEDPCDGCTGTESKYEPMVSPDGTLIVNVPKGTKVKRVIVLPYAD